ncbi:MAG: radical SAM protein [Ruminiclostridium sp.]|nr:radical SAM protein [Ruminiclostridium sp.]
MSTIKEKMQSLVLTQALDYLEGNPEENIPKLMALMDKLLPQGWYESQRSAVRTAIQEKNNWYQLILRLYDLDPAVRKTALQNLVINASLKGSAIQEAAAEEHQCNVPWAILMDPTSACNLQCVGCWAAEYGSRLELTLDDLDSIVRQGKELGTYMYLYTGGEPLVRKKDILELCRMHPDCQFLAFTNGTLIDEAFCQGMLEVKNFVPAISLEGFQEANDQRRGQGTYDKIRRAMGLLKAHKLPFGISACYTSQNWETISSEAFFDMLIGEGAFFLWLFHYMPVGGQAQPALLPTPDQREAFRSRIQAFRKTKALFTVDFQHDGQYVGGCIAGGRKYLHINAKGDVEPCAFIHYSTANIHEVTLLEALQSPLFQAYRKNQPFNENMLRPCPMLENPEKLRDMVRETGAISTEYETPEDPEDLCDRCRPYAAAWAPTAERLWENKG